MPSASPASTTATAATASASQTTSAMFCLRMPSSTIRLTSSGVTTTRAASTTVRPRNIEIGRRCGLAKPSTRRTVFLASFWSPMLRSVRMCRHTGPMPDPSTSAHLPSSASSCSPAHQRGELAEPADLGLALGEALVVEVSFPALCRRALVSVTAP